MASPATVLFCLLTGFLLPGLFAGLAAPAAAARPQSGVVAVAPSALSISWSGQQRAGPVGTKLFQDDLIRTGPSGGARLLLMDQSHVTLGPDSQLLLDEFIYDPAAGTKGQMTVKILSGGFKFLSGRLSAGKGQLHIALPSAVAAIRGTQLAGQVTPDGDTRLLLLAGAVEITGRDEGPVWLTRSGWGVDIPAAGQPGQPFFFSPDEAAALLQAASPAASPATISAPSQQAAAPLSDLAARLQQAVPADRHGQLSASDIADYIRAAGLAGQTGLRPGDLDDPANRQNLITAGLLDYALSGGQPFWASVLPAGGVGNIAPPPPLPGQTPSLDWQLWQETYHPLLSPSYAGTARFASPGFALGRGQAEAGGTLYHSAQTGSGTGFFDLELSYETGRFSGRFGWHDLQLNGQIYADQSASIDSPAAPAASQILDQPIGVLASSQPAGAGARLKASIGSISDGTHLLDGQLGGFAMEIHDAGHQEFIRDGEGRLLDRDGQPTTDQNQAVAIPALSATLWTRGE